MSAVQRFPQKSNSRVSSSHPLPGAAGDRGHGKRSLSQEGIGHVRFPSQQEVVAFQTKSKALGEWENSQDFTSGVGFFFPFSSQNQNSAPPVFRHQHGVPMFRITGNGYRRAG